MAHDWVDRTSVSGPHNRQELAPFDELSEQGECDSRGVVRAARPDLAFDVTGELLSEKQSFGPPVAFGNETSAAAGATGQRAGRMPFGTRAPIMTRFQLRSVGARAARPRDERQGPRRRG